MRDGKLKRRLATAVVLAVLPVLVGCQPAQDGNALLELLQAFALDFVRQITAAFLL